MIKTTVSDKILNFLKTDLIQNLNILGIIENVPTAEIYVDNEDAPKGVLVRNGYFSFVYTKEESFIDDILENVIKKDDFYGFSGLEENTANKLRKHITNQWESPCDLYYLPKENFNPSLKKNATREISLEDAEKIDINYAYRNEGSLQRIKDDILYRPNSAIYVDGEIVCWVLEHNDNSMGIMYTMEDHRGKGYAVDVTIDLCDKLLKQGKIPFLQINRHNGMSPGLAKKCGFVKCGSAIWFGGIKGMPKYFFEISDTLYSNIREHFNDNELYDKYVAPGKCEDFLVCYFELKPYEKTIDDFEIRKVTADEDIKVWCETAAKGFRVSVDLLETFISKLYTSISSNKQQYDLYLGYVNDKPVSTAGVYKIENESPGICYISSDPEYSEKGLEDINISKILTAIHEQTDWECSNIRISESKSRFLESLGILKIASKKA